MLHVFERCDANRMMLLNYILTPDMVADPLTKPNDVDIFGKHVTTMRLNRK